MKIIFFLFFLFSCARPNYESVPSLGKQNETADSCSLYFSSEDLCVDVKWVTEPTEQKEGEFTFTFHEKERPEVFHDPRFSPKVVLWMPAMGHGSTPVTVTHLADGLYKASDVFFIMRGSWEIRIQNGNNSDEKVSLTLLY